MKNYIKHIFEKSILYNRIMILLMELFDYLVKTRQNKSKSIKLKTEIHGFQKTKAAKSKDVLYNSVKYRNDDDYIVYILKIVFFTIICELSVAHPHVYYR